MRLSLRERALGFAIACAVIVAPAACSSDSENGPREQTRSFYMGFSNFPPAPDTSLVRRTLELLIGRSDAAIMHLDVPWAALLSGGDPDSLVEADVHPLAFFYRNHGLKVVIETDVTNGVNRTAEAPALVALGRSITEDTVQKLYESYVIAIAHDALPDYLGLASETNLIRLAGPPGVYAAIVHMTNDAIPRLRAGSASLLYVSVQVEVAWGRLGGGGGAYVGVDRDLADFAFIDELGLSSYPYLAGFAQPSEVPADYFSRVGGARRVLVTEGGWSSADYGSIHASPAIQADWIRRASTLVANAHTDAWLQLSLTDINLSAFGLDSNDPQVAPFVRIGLVDTALAPKPSLAVWDSVRAIPLVPNSHSLSIRK